MSNNISVDQLLSDLKSATSSLRTYAATLRALSKVEYREAHSKHATDLEIQVSLYQDVIDRFIP